MYLIERLENSDSVKQVVSVCLKCSLGTVFKTYTSFPLLPTKKYIFENYKEISFSVHRARGLLTKGKNGKFDLHNR